MRNTITRSGLAALAAISVWATLACDDSTGLVASIPNEVDTTTVYALRLTPLTTPSGFDIVNARAVRTDMGAIFDFAFDIDDSNVGLISPAGALNLTPQPGVQMLEDSFDEIDRAPDTDYIVNRSVSIRTGDIFVARSRNSSEFCGYYGALPRYGKFHVLSVDLSERSVTFEFLVNQNCGFRSLKPGYPNY